MCQYRAKAWQNMTKVRQNVAEQKHTQKHVGYATVLHAAELVCSPSLQNCAVVRAAVKPPKENICGALMCHP
jgi:hypothetical protein